MPADDAAGFFGQAEFRIHDNTVARSACDVHLVRLLGSGMSRSWRNKRPHSLLVMPLLRGTPSSVGGRKKGVGSVRPRRSVPRTLNASIAVSSHGSSPAAGNMTGSNSPRYLALVLVLCDLVYATKKPSVSL